MDINLILKCNQCHENHWKLFGCPCNERTIKRQIFSNRISIVLLIVLKKHVSTFGTEKFGGHRKIVWNLFFFLIVFGASEFKFGKNKMLSKLIVFCLVISIILIGLAAGDEAKKDGYETKYDNIDLDELLKNDRLRKNYVKCLLNEGPCTPDAQELKSKTKAHKNPFKQITESLTALKDFLVQRFTSRRNSHKLLEMHREAKKWFRKSDTLSNW